MFSRRYPYLFITGKPRSGTTWLLEIFKEHPNGRYVSIRDLEIDSDGVETLETGVFFRGFSKENIRDRFRKLRKDPFDFFVEKTPTHFQKADIIKECFPDAFILHVNRNPLDVINSWLQSNVWWKSAPKTLEQAIELFNRLEKDEERFSRFFDAEIYYEDLWDDPCRTLKPILKKMGISDLELKDMVVATQCGRSLSHSFQEKKVFRKGEPGEGLARFSKEKEHIIQCLDLRVHMKERYFRGCGKNLRSRDNSEELRVSEIENEFAVDMKHSPIPKSGELSRKRLLLTNHHLENISGSEVTTLEMALVFKELGYDIHVATFSYGEPIQKYFKENGIKVFNVLEAALPYSEYDIAWCHHSPVLSQIVKQGVRLKNVILRTLSPYEPLEALPAYVDAIDIVLANSEETAERYYSEGWIKKEKIEVFPNSVLSVFFNESRLRQNPAISKIAVVSNHVPDELKKAVEIIRSRSVIVDILGRGGTPKLVTPDVLKPYDLIITIGKTVQFCFAMRTPVYCYDRFGGPGYMTEENCRSAEYFNYSGRCCNRKLQPDKLADEILEGYAGALHHLDCMQKIAMSRYHLVANIKSVLNKLEDFCVNEVFYGRKFTKEIAIQLVHSEYYKTVLRKYARLQKEMAVQLAHSEYYKTVLREYAQLQDNKRVEGESGNKDISIAIKIAAPNPEQTAVWGDYHLALALQRGLRKAGFSARVDTVSEWYDDTRRDDVVLVFRGLRRYETKPHQLNIMWNISHPDKVTLQEYESYDLVLVSSDKYAEVLQRRCLVPVRVMHQFSDPQIFSPKFVDSIQTDLLFVGNSRGQYRNAVKACVEQNLKVDVYGRKWEAFVSDEYIKGQYISQGDLAAYYHSARIVLNDHWDTMRECGFVSNRVYDVGASGGFLLTDNCAGIREMFGDAIAVFDDGKDLKRQVEYFLDHPEERLQKAKKLREIVLNAHTLTNRVEQLTKLINDLLTRGKTAQTATMPETNGPKVSIVMACHNAAAFLPETMDTILAQTLKEWELLVTDDGSTDATRKILETYAAKDQRIRLWFFDDQKGPYVRRNFAIQQSQAPFICIQDADDLMAPNKLEILYEEINRDKQLGIVGSFYRRFLDTFRGADFGDRMEKRITHEELMAAFPNCWHLCWHGSAIIRKSLFETIGLYDEQPYGSDTFWLSKAGLYGLLTGQVRFKNLPEFLTYKREHAQSQTGKISPADPRSRRHRLERYYLQKLQQIAEEAKTNPSMNAAQRIRECTCTDFIPKFGHLFGQWESAPVNATMIQGLISRGLSQFSQEQYVSALITLNCLDQMVPGAGQSYRNLNFTRGLAHYACGDDEQAAAYIQKEIQLFQSQNAQTFLTRYLGAEDSAISAADRRANIRRFITESSQNTTSGTALTPPQGQLTDPSSGLKEKLALGRQYLCDGKSEEALGVYQGLLSDNILAGHIELQEKIRKLVEGIRLAKTAQASSLTGLNVAAGGK